MVGVESLNEALHLVTWSGRLLAAAVPFMLIGYGFRRRWPALAAVPAAVGGVAIVLALVIPLFFLRTAPPPLQTDLFEGVTYQRLRLQDPVPQVVHVVTVDLKTPGLRLMVTPPAPTRSRGTVWQVPARTTSGFLRAFDQQLAVNASFFYEQTSYSIFYYYPRAGDGVSIVGRAMSGGQLYSDYDPSTLTLWFFDGRAEVSREERPAQHAVSGYPLVVDGSPPPAVLRSEHRHPRTAAGVDASGHTLLLVVIDGRQPFYAEGATLGETAKIIMDAGAENAILLDGGGSSALVRRTPAGAVEVMNWPVHGRTPPGYERPVGNHIGLSGLRPPPALTTQAHQ